MQLQQALGVVPGDVVAFIGAGGKTSLLVGLGYELAEAGWRVLATTTAQLSADQLSLFPRAMSSRTDSRELSRALSEDQFVLLYDDIRAGQVYGPPQSWTRHLLDRVDSDITLVEADCAAGKPFKAPLHDEPYIPLETSLVVPVASLSALGAPLDEQHIYNPQAMIDRYGFARNAPVKSAWLAQVLRDEMLGLRGAPGSARVVIYLNQAPARGYALGRARMIARLCLHNPRVSGVALGSARGAQPVVELQRSVGAMVLASEDACAAADIARQLMRSRLRSLVVVVGRGADKVRAAIKPLGVRPARDASAARIGGVSAIQGGWNSLRRDVEAALIVPGDRRAISPKLIYQLLTAYARGADDLIVPRNWQSAAPPMLMSRCLYYDVCDEMKRSSSLLDMLAQFEDRIAWLDTATGRVDSPPQTVALSPNPLWTRSL